MRRKIFASALTGALMLGGVMATAPSASATALQNGCQGTSFKLYSETTGYCFNGLGYSYPFYVYSISIQSDAYAGDIQLEDCCGNWYWVAFGYQTSAPLNHGSGIPADQVYLASID